MSKFWERQERNGNAGVLRALAWAVVTVVVIIGAVYATGGLELFDTLKGF